MKTFTMLAAVAALVGAMITYADAQSTMGGSQQPKAGSMSQSSSMGMQGKQTGNGKFCIEQSAGGGWDCKYASLQACEKDAKPLNRQCHPNSSTTGSKQ
jgi:hypothetical protein